MRRIVVLPAEATSTVAPLLGMAGWEAVTTPGEVEAGARAALDVVRRGNPALYVPRTITTVTELRRILVVHEGTRADRAGIDAADEAAVASGGEVIVLHVPPSAPSMSSASLPFRMADHGAYDYAEWRDEFLRRFCRCSAGVRVTLRMSIGSIDNLRREISAANADLVIVSGPGEVESGRSSVLDVVLEGVIPVLIVPSVGQEGSPGTAAASSAAETMPA